MQLERLFQRGTRGVGRGRGSARPQPCLSGVAGGWKSGARFRRAGSIAG